MSEETTVPENLDNQPNLQAEAAPEPNQSEGQLENTSNSEVETGQEKGSYNQTIPYGRFQEVNEQKNTFKTNWEKTQQENEQLKQALQSLTGGVKPETSEEPINEQDNLSIKDQVSQALQEINTQNEQASYDSKVEKNWTEKLGEAKSKYSDFDATMSNTTAPLPPPMIEKAIMASDKAGDLYYSLAKNPSEAARIFNLPPHEAIMALGSFAATLPGTTGQPKKSPGMPDPIQTVGTSKVNTVAGDTDYENQSQEDFDANNPVIW